MSFTSSLGGDVSNVRNTFSSWDACMAKSYCKYPVIAGIIIGSLILLSVLWCVASCLCCGATLCGSCIRCLTCFNCCGLCGSRRGGGGGGGGGGGSRHKDDYTQMAPSPYNGYQPPTAPMAYQQQPQFAQFDTTKKINADSLPAMPTWENARSVRVEDHSEPTTGFGDDVELGNIRPAPPQPLSTRRGYNQVPLAPASPLSPSTGYGHFEGQAHEYSSDLGAQRLGRQQSEYSDFNPSPLSPAPTYRTNATEAAMGHSGRYNGGASPSPSVPMPIPQEQRPQQYSGPVRSQAWSPLPETHHEVTDYQSFRRSPSPPPEHQPLTYGQYQQDQYSARPPSLLQVGRKPLGGSQREI